MLGGDEAGFADFGEGCVMLAGVCFIDTLGSDVEIYFVLLCYTLAFIVRL